MYEGWENSQPSFINKKTMKTQEKPSMEEIQENLSYFHGTEMYHTHQLGVGLKILITDGCHYLREAAGCYWLFDLILSYQMRKTIQKESFQVWRLRKNHDESAVVNCTDGNGKFIVKQKIEYTDFPLDTIEVWLVDGIGMLPGEY